MILRPFVYEKFSVYLVRGDAKLKIGYYYRGRLLGELEETKNGFSYTSNIDNEQYFMSSHILTPSEYELWNSCKRVSKTLFSEFESLLKRCSRKDILETAGISSTDSKWEALVKLSKLEWNTPNTYVGQIL